MGVRFDGAVWRVRAYTAKMAIRMTKPAIIKRRRNGVGVGVGVDGSVMH